MLQSHDSLGPNECLFTQGFALFSFFLGGFLDKVRSGGMERDGVGWLAHYAHYMVGRGGPWGHRGVEDSVAIAGYDSLLPSQTRLESVLRNLEILSGGLDRLTTVLLGSVSVYGSCGDTLERGAAVPAGTGDIIRQQIEASVVLMHAN